MIARRLAVAFCAAAIMHLREWGTTPSRFLLIVLQPILLTLLAVLMLRERSAEGGLFHAVVGSGLASQWGSLVGVASFAVYRERRFGTLQHLAATPTPLAVILAGTLFGDVVLGLAALLTSFVVAFALLGQPLQIGSPGLFLVSLGVGGLGLVAISLLILPLMVLSRAMLYWVNTLDYPMWVLAGFLFPIALLPGWTTPLSYALTPYWLAEALHRSADGAGIQALAPLWATILGLSLLYLALAGLVFRLVLWRARVTAELSLY